jgi:hypothetical protein
MKLELYNTKTMKLEIISLDDCEPGTIYLVPKIVRCKKCDCIIQHSNGWKCPACETQWQFSDYASYFGMIQFEEKAFKLREFCSACKFGDMKDRIMHLVQEHGAIYFRAQKTIRYVDNVIDVIPPSLIV